MVWTHQIPQVARVEHLEVERGAQEQHQDSHCAEAQLVAMAPLCAFTVRGSCCLLHVQGTLFVACLLKVHTAAGRPHPLGD